MGDAGNDALVDLHLAQQALRPAFSAGDLRIAQAERLRRDRIQPGGDPARLVAVVRGDALAAVVDRPGTAGERDEAILDDLQRAQARFLGFLHHPQQRDVAQALVRIAAADVRVHAGEPDLLQAVLPDLQVPGHAVLVQFVPEQRQEGIALVVQRQRVPGALDPHVQAVVGHAQREDPVVDGARQLREGTAVGRDGVPHADEADGRARIVLPLVARHIPQPRVPGTQDHVADPAERLGRPFEPARQPGAAELAIGVPAQSIELALVVRLHQSLVRDQGHDEARGECAAAEAERIDGVALLVVAAGVLVDVEDVPLQAVAEHAAEDRQRLEPRRADAVVVVGDLRAAIGRRRAEVHRLVHAPDVGLEQLGAAVAGAVREQHDGLARRRGARRVDLGCRSCRVVVHGVTSEAGEAGELPGRGGV